MKNKKYLFVGLFVLAILPTYAASLLQPVSFPKVFKDVPFKERWDVIAEGYEAFDRQYDAEGRCIVGCPYQGITIKQDQEDVEEATQAFADIVQELGGFDTFDNYQNTNNGYVNPGESGGNPPTYTNNGSTGQYNSGGTTSHARDAIPLRSPVNNSSIAITSDFYFRTSSGVQGFHGGVDIGVPYGTPVVATGDGVVVVAGRTDYNGPYVKIKHDRGLYSWYLHLSQINVSTGTHVKKGDVIGLSGSAGKRSQGAHLDYRISMEKNGHDIWVDVLCPCMATKKKARSTGYNQSTTASYNENVGEYQCVHSSFWRDDYYRFADSATKQRGAKWRVQSGHCMRNLTDKLPDEK